MNAHVGGLRKRWQQLSRRDQQLCGLLALFLLIVFAVYGLWQPAQQRLAQAQTKYFKQRALASQLQLATPARAAKAFDQPLSTRLSESAVSAGLNVQQFDIEPQTLRISVTGDAIALLNWLERIEQDGAEFHSLSLEKRGLEKNSATLDAHLVLNTPQPAD